MRSSPVNLGAAVLQDGVAVPGADVTASIGTGAGATIASASAFDGGSSANADLEAGDGFYSAIIAGLEPGFAEADPDVPPVVLGVRLEAMAPSVPEPIAGRCRTGSSPPPRYRHSAPNRVDQPAKLSPEALEFLRERLENPEEAWTARQLAEAVTKP